MGITYCAFQGSVGGTGAEKALVCLEKTDLEQLAKSAWHLRENKKKRTLEEGEGGKKKVKADPDSQTHRQEGRQKRETECVGGQRCSEAILTIRVRRMQNVWASNHLLKPLVPDLRLALSA